MTVRACTALLFAGLVLAAAGCTPDAPEAAHAPTPDTIEVMVTPWALPSPDGASQPDLVAAPDGSLLLSWIEPDGDGHALRFARYRDDAWSAPQAIARGNDWFINWADTPHIAATADGALWAHWLRKSGAAKYAYDIVLARSADDGATWSRPILVNEDGTATEHGFAALWPVGPDSLGIAWLDGRETAANGVGHDAHSSQVHAAGRMTLRSMRLDAALQRHDEVRLDATTCDCCQTGAAATADGSLIAYRDRSEGEVRDISILRHDGSRWLPGKLLHEDGWVMPACPVNGPAVAARGDDVVVAWYTEGGGTPRLRATASGDAGATFQAPVDIDIGAPVLGRVGVALGNGAAWTAWLREDEGVQSLHVARHGAGLSGSPTSREVARLAGRGRGTGFPQLAMHQDRAYLAWTEVVDGAPRLRGAVASGLHGSDQGGPAAR